MEQSTAQLTAVHGPRTVNTKNGAMNVWDAQFSNNIRATIWEAPLAQIATSLVNQQVDFSYESKPNKDPQYPPNHTLKAIAAAQNGGAVQPQGGMSGGLPLAPAISPEPIRHDDKSDRIERQSAYKASIDLYSRLYSGIDPDGVDEEGIWKKVQQRTDALAYYAKHGRWQDTELLVPGEADAGEDWV